MHRAVPAAAAGGGEGTSGRSPGAPADDEAAVIAQILSSSSLLLRRPRMLLCGPAGAGQVHVGPALLHSLEMFAVHSIGLPALLSDPGARSPEEALVVAVAEARRAAPAVLFLPNVRLWWEAAKPMLRATLTILLEVRSLGPSPRPGPAVGPAVSAVDGIPLLSVRIYCGS